MKFYQTKDDVFKHIDFRLDEPVTVVIPEPKKDTYTGREYSSIELTLRKCRCMCHVKGGSAIHFMPCCDQNGIVVDQIINYND